ncbi:MAG: alanine racemase [Desulfovibrio sp.]|uniref:alanine racemase n=1 Tax=Desulfovibrio sp. 7SRBS1 TaxID=3378064 RepID=UPI003B3E2E82
MSRTEAIWAEIDLSAIRHNFRQVADTVAPKTKVMAVVKADAYGHGAVPVAKAVITEGAAFLGVARLCEAIALRDADIETPILILGYTPPSQAQVLGSNNITQAVYSLEYAHLLEEEAAKAGCTVQAHLKVDSGMGRIGLLPPENNGPQNFPDILQELRQLKHLHFDGLFTHFASSDSQNLTNARRQLDIFKKALRHCEDAGFSFSWVHASNSAAVMTLPDARFDMVRLGISLYGLYPSNEVDKSVLDLRPAMSIKARLAHIKRVPAGVPVSYGHTYTTNAETTIGTVPVGYADGYDRLLSNPNAIDGKGGMMLVGGKRVPVVGRVCMDQTMIDLSAVPNAAIEDEVVLLGRQGDEEYSADEWAERLKTINYEVVSRLMPRVKRIYVG